MVSIFIEKRLGVFVRDLSAVGIWLGDLLFFEEKWKTSFKVLYKHGLKLLGALDMLLLVYRGYVRRRDKLKAQYKNFSKNGNGNFMPLRENWLGQYFKHLGKSLINCLNN